MLKLDRQEVDLSESGCVCRWHERLARESVQDCLERAHAVLSGGVDIGSYPAEHLAGVLPPEGSGYLLLDLGHPLPSFGQIVVEWHGEVMGEEEHAVPPQLESREKVDRLGLLCSSFANHQAARGDFVLACPILDGDVILRRQGGELCRVELVKPCGLGRVDRLLDGHDGVRHPDGPALPLHQHSHPLEFTEVVRSACAITRPIVVVKWIRVGNDSSLELGEDADLLDRVVATALVEPEMAEPPRSGEVDVVVPARTSHRRLVGVEHFDAAQLFFDGLLRLLSDFIKAFARIDDRACAHLAQEKRLHQLGGPCEGHELEGAVDIRGPSEKLRAVLGGCSDVGWEFANTSPSAVGTRLLQELVLGGLGWLGRRDVRGLPSPDDTPGDAGQVVTAMRACVRRARIDMVGIVDPVRSASWMPFLATWLPVAPLPKAPLVGLFTKPVAARRLRAVGAVGLEPGIKLLDFLCGLLQHCLKLGNPFQGGAIVVHDAIHGQVKYA